MNTHPTQPPVVTPATALRAKSIDCAIAGCNSKFETTKPASTQVRYLCSHHSRKEHVAAVGRVFDSDTDEQDRGVRFQKYQFDKSLRRSKRPVGTGHIHRQGNPTNEGDESTELLLNKIAQSLPKRFNVQTATNYESHRPESPAWVKAKDLLVTFIKSWLGTRECQDLEQEKVPLWAALDYVILTEYYLQYSTDEDIYEKYEHRLREEAGGKKRWTSSVNALKNRRLRLVKEGNAMFRANGPIEEADRAQETDRNDKAA
jgi:hypothetical protein